jgi:hypothetical protein
MSAGRDSPDLLAAGTPLLPEQHNNLKLAVNAVV